MVGTKALDASVLLPDISESCPTSEPSGLARWSWEASPVATPGGVPIVRAPSGLGSVGVPLGGDARGNLTLYRYRTVHPDSHRRLASRISEPHSGDYEHAIPEAAPEAGDTPRTGEAAAEEHLRQPAADHAYDDEGSQQCARGAVSVSPGRWWAGRLMVPVTNPADVAFLRIQRHGEPPTGYLGEDSADVSVPVTEIDDVLALLVGLVAQARRDGVLPSVTVSAPTTGGDAPQPNG
jgi:hypothetical protein